MNIIKCSLTLFLFFIFISPGLLSAQNEMKKITLKSFHSLEKEIVIDSIAPEKERLSDSLNRSLACKESIERYYQLLDSFKNQIVLNSREIKQLNQQHEHSGYTYYLNCKCNSEAYHFKDCGSIVRRSGICTDYIFEVKKCERSRAKMKDGTTGTIFYYMDLKNMPRQDY